jgi:hypothetical protein
MNLPLRLTDEHFRDLLETPLERLTPSALRRLKDEAIRARAFEEEHDQLARMLGEAHDAVVRALGTKSGNLPARIRAVLSRIDRLDQVGLEEPKVTGGKR